MTATVNTPTTPFGGGGAPLQLHDYQKVAVEFVRKRKRAGLFLDMGLG